MSHDSHSWIDDELRRVPLPPDLLERLRRTAQLGDKAQLSDKELDDVIREVPLPIGLLARLQQIPGDEELDHRLNEVPVPTGLLAELQYIPQDEQLREVPLPAGLLVQLRAIVPRPRRRLRAAQLALAASLLLTITLTYLVAMGGLAMSAYDRLPQPRPSVFLIDDSIRLDSEAADENELALLIEANHSPSAETLPLQFAGLVESLPATGGLLDDMKLPPGYELADSIMPLKYGILGQPHQAEDRVPELEMLRGPEARGIETPVKIGFDRKFLITERTQPVLSFDALAGLGLGSRLPSATKALARNSVPLWTQTTDFLRAERLAAAGQLPEASDVHLEDFVAAMDYEYFPEYFPVPAEQLGIRVAAGPSVFGENGAKLLQVGVQAGRLKRISTRPRHLVLAVDVSDSMRFADRLAITRQTLRQLIRQLDSRDRVSLVVFHDEAFCLIDEAAAGDEQLLSAIDAMQPSGGTNIGAGLQLAAISATGGLRSTHRREVVLISDGVPPIPPDTSAKIEQLLHDVAADGVSWTVMDVSGQAAPDRHLAEFAAAGGGSVVAAGDGQIAPWQLLEAVIGRSCTVANDAELTIEFNPQAVSAYRLLGHEAVSIGGLATVAVPSQLRAGEAGTALYEVWLRPSGEDHVATVQVTWRDAAGEEETIRQEVRRVQFAPAFQESPLSLQAATIAAEAAEVLRQSPFAATRNGRDLRPVLALAEDVNPRLAGRESFRRYVEVLQRIENVRRRHDN